ncbi:amidase [Mycena crocata]|nr:amidase [Mycena crocata]
MWPFLNVYTIRSELKQNQRAAAISAAPPFSPSEHGAFLKATASEIVTHIERGEWTALQVVKAFISRAALAHAATNCVTEVLFAEALKQAQELDAEFASTKVLRGPLHGVPISIKGVDSSMGLSSLLQRPASTDADVVALLKAAGAIPIVKTNVPQTMFSFECCNPVFGRSTNPYNDGFTCGGSSGGEAALLSMDGSALGVGSDIGGSLRIPAAFCGIYSLKPSPLRVSFAGAGSSVPGFEGITSVGGPMARSVEDLEIFCRVTFGVQRRSHDLAPILYRQPKLPEKLRFGYYSDFYIKASPANKRAILETVTALRGQGHECIEIEVPDPTEPMNTFVALTSGDGYSTLLSGIPPDPLDSSLLVIAYGSSLPRFIRVIVAWIVEKLFKDVKFAGTVRSTGAKPFREVLQWTARRNKYNRRFYEEVWNKHALDGIIAPVQSVPQVPTGTFTTLFALASATILYNVVNCPAGCIPVTLVDPLKDGITDEWAKAASPSLVERALYRGKTPIYDPVTMKGMPVGIQVVGKKWEDEKVLAMMRVVDSALGKDRGFGPGNWDTRKTS